MLVLTAACQLEAPSSDPTATTTGALKQNSGVVIAQHTSTSGFNPAEHTLGDVVVSGGPCECTKTFKDWSTASTPSCDAPKCATEKEMEACDEGTSTNCNYLRSCTCYCEFPPVEEFVHEPGDGVYLTGVPELWQFEYGCISSPLGIANVGCGPVALASMFYWWAQRGYAGLVEDHQTSMGQQDWQDLLREIRDEYADDGVCLGRQYLVTQDEMEKELNDYVDDHGASGNVAQYRVCDGCNLQRATDRTKSGGLDVIQNELEAGRPLVLGYAEGMAERSSVDVDGLTVFTGDLSGDGFATHYAVITGYRRTSDGRDVIFINKGSAFATVDVVMEWKPAGKWTHLFTLGISSNPSGAAFCPVDSSLDQTYVDHADVEVSHAAKSDNASFRQFTPLAGRRCGIARDGKYKMITPWERTTDYCPLRALEDFTDPNNPDSPPLDANTPLDQLGPM